MQSKNFDLNDIQNKPKDADSEALMNTVAIEGKRRAGLPRLVLLQLKRDNAAANGTRLVA